MAQSKQLSSLAAILILAFMSFVFTTIGGAFTLFSYDFYNNADEVTGTVISVSHSTTDSTTTYKPIIAFNDRNGIKRTGETYLSSSTYNYALGEQVEIMYDMRDPTSLRMNNGFALWGFGFIFLFVGVGLTVIMLVVIAKRRKKRKELRRGANEPRSEPRRETRPESRREPKRKHPPAVRRR